MARCPQAISLTFLFLDTWAAFFVYNVPLLVSASTSDAVRSLGDVRLVVRAAGSMYVSPDKSRIDPRGPDEENREHRGHELSGGPAGHSEEREAYRREAWQKGDEEDSKVPHYDPAKQTDNARNGSKVDETKEDSGELQEVGGLQGSEADAIGGFEGRAKATTYSRRAASAIRAGHKKNKPRQLAPATGEVFATSELVPNRTSIDLNEYEMDSQKSGMTTSKFLIVVVVLFCCCEMFWRIVESGYDRKTRRLGTLKLEKVSTSSSQAVKAGAIDSGATSQSKACKHLAPNMRTPAPTVAASLRTPSTDSLRAPRSSTRSSSPLSCRSTSAGGLSEPSQ